MSDFATVEIAGQTYRVGKLSALKQLHVYRRLLPLLAQLTPLFKMVRNAPASVEGSGIKAALLNIQLDQLTPIADGIASLPDESVNYLIGTCLGQVSRRIPGDLGWAKAWNEAAASPQFEDMELPIIMQLLMTSIFHNLQGFLAAASMTGNPGAATALPAG